MKKRLMTATALVLCALLLLCGCAVVNEERDMAQVVAQVGDTTITKGEVVDQFNNAGYPSYLTQYGYTQGTDEYNEAALSSLTSILDTMVDNEVQLQAATAAGITLTEEEIQEKVEDTYQQTIDSLTTSAQAELAASASPAASDATATPDASTTPVSDATATPDASATAGATTTPTASATAGASATPAASATAGASATPAASVDPDTQAQIDAKIDEQFAASGYTRESYKQQLTDAAIIEKYKETTLEGKELSEEELSAQYAELVTTQQTKYVGATGTWETPEEGKDLTSTGVETDYKSGTVAYMPGKFNAVTNLLVKFDQETQDAISAVQADESLSEEEIATQVAALQETGYAAIQQKAETLLAQAQQADKESFAALIAENGEDTGMTGDSLTYGYLTGENTSFVESFRTAALAFTEVGQVSELVPSTYGYHILRCEYVFQPGEVPLEQVHDRYKAEADATYQDEFYTEHLATLKKDAGVKTYADRLKLNS